MSRTKKMILIGIICVIVIAGVAVALGFLINSILPKTYSSAKRECEEVLEKYQVQMEEIANNSLKSEKGVSGDFNGYYYSCYAEEGCVHFDIDAQGMLGGQYWELVYTDDGTFYGETESYLYEEIGGNNIRKAERLDAHWWFLWTNYDGTERSYQ